jgi:hypothetical protein
MNAFRCQTKRGVMTLRLCDEPSVATCAQCQRPVCQLHLADPARSLCVSCAATANASAGPAKKSAPPSNPNWADDHYDHSIDVGWAYLYSDWYYTSHARDMAYRDDDTRSFATRDNGDIGPEKESSAPGFLDS